MEIYGIVYLATNRVNGKVYVGQTVDTLERRQAGHKSAAYSKNGRKEKCRKFYAAIRKHGWDSFKWRILEASYKTGNGKADKDCLDELENKYFNEYNARDRALGYNIQEAGSHGRHSEETKARISTANKGGNRTSFKKGHSTWMKGRKHSAQTKAKISAAGKGRKMSAEARARISAANKGRKMPAEVRARISSTLKGHPVSAESRAKMSASHKGTKLSVETRAKLRGKLAWNKGKTASEKTKAKLRAAGKKAWADSEYRERMSMALRKAWENPECRKNASDSAKKRWADLEQRKKRSESSKMKWSDSEYRKKQLARGRFTEEQVLDIRKRANDGAYGIIGELAKEYEVSTSLISMIKTGKRYAHIKAGD